MRRIIILLLLLSLSIPLKGSKVAYWYDFYEHDSRALQSKTGLSDNGLVLSGTDKIFTGLYQSKTLVMPHEFKTLRLLLDSYQPPGTNIDVCFATYSDSWSTWKYIENYERIELNSSCEKIKFLVTLSSNNGINTPVVKNLGMELNTELNLRVPWISQLDPQKVKGKIGGKKLINRGACAPASIAMILKYFGRDVSVHQVAERTYNRRLDLLGCWRDMVEAIESFGLQSELKQVDSWKEIRKQIDAGNPVIISIAGCLSNAPWADNCTDGHILVVNGVTSDGDLICNDPGTSYKRKGKDIVYDRSELSRAFFGHKGVAITVDQKSISMK